MIEAIKAYGDYILVFLNGRFVEKNEAKISIFDRGYLFGDGVYEVIPIFKGKAFLFKEHIQRLNKSLEAIKINGVECNWQEVLQRLLKEEDQAFNGMLYLQVTRGEQEKRNHQFVNLDLKPSILGFLQAVDFATENEVAKGYRAILREDYRWQRCDIKSISLLPNILLKAEADYMGCLEVILHRNGTVTEASASNVFIVKNRVVYTHPANHLILNGITRQHIILEIRSKGIVVKEQSFSTADLMDADEVWVTSSTKNIAPIIEIDGVAIGSGFTGDLWREVTDQN